MTAENVAPPTLNVDFCGAGSTAHPGRTITFGRNADIVIDDNRFLHRVLGEFSHHGALWWLSNVGSSISISVHDEATTSFARIAPGASLPLAFGSSSVRFDAGGSSYELTVDVTGDPERPDAGRSDVPMPDHEDVSQSTTTTAGLPLTDEQFDLLRALAEPLLRGGDKLPTNRRVATSLGWTVTKLNRKLDGLCTKYAKAGVTGLRGSIDQLATDRRTRLAEHVIDAGIVTSADLD